jgi:hypothetical protein
MSITSGPIEPVLIGRARSLSPSLIVAEVIDIAVPRVNCRRWPVLREPVAATAIVHCENAN